MAESQAQLYGRLASALKPYVGKFGDVQAQKTELAKYLTDEGFSSDDVNSILSSAQNFDNAVLSFEAFTVPRVVGAPAPVGAIPSVERLGTSPLFSLASEIARFDGFLDGTAHDGNKANVSEIMRKHGVTEGEIAWASASNVGLSTFLHSVSHQLGPDASQRGPGPFDAHQVDILPG